jgi:L-asparaginase
VKKIILITTGGTIASTLKNNAIGIDETQQSLRSIITTVKKKLSCQIDIKSPLNKNSEAFLPNDWLKIIRCLKEASNDSNVSGIVVTHGTDTLAYSLAAVMCYQSIWPTKICFTGAYYPPTHPKSDGSLNLLAAIHLVLSDISVNGNYLAFRADDSNTKVNIIDGAYLKPMDFDGQYFESFYHKIMASFTIDHGLSKLKSASLSPFPCLENTALPTQKALFNAQKQIAFISVYPGMDQELLKMMLQNRKIIIITLYHCGTGSADWVDLIKMYSKKVTFLMGTFPKKYIDIPYESTRKMQQAGAFIYTDLQPYFLYVFSLLSWSIGGSQNKITQTLLPWELNKN